MKRRISDVKPICLFAFYGDNAVVAVASSETTEPPECEKTQAVSQLVIGRYSNERVATEINKCELFCANCHRRHHVDPIEIDAD